MSAPRGLNPSSGRGLRTRTTRSPTLWKRSIPRTTWRGSWSCGTECCSFVKGRSSSGRAHYSSERGSWSCGMGHCSLERRNCGTACCSSATGRSNSLMAHCSSVKGRSSSAKAHYSSERRSWSCGVGHYSSATGFRSAGRGSWSSKWTGCCSARAERYSAKGHSTRSLRRRIPAEETSRSTRTRNRSATGG